MSQASLRIGVVVAALVHLAAPAHADAGDGDGADAGGADDAAGTPASVTPSEQARSRARVLLDAGNQLMDAGDHLGALELYRQAHAAYPSPRLRVAMGTSLWNLGRYTEAAEAFEEALASAELDAALRAELLARLAELARSIAVITITIDAAGGDGAAAERLARASLVVDGRHVPLVDGRAAVRVDPGAHVILVEAPGSPPWTGTVELAPGEQRPLGVDLEALPVIAPRVVERLVVRARPCAGPARASAPARRCSSISPAPAPPSRSTPAGARPRGSISPAASSSAATSPCMAPRSRTWARRGSAPASRSGSWCSRPTGRGPARARRPGSSGAPAIGSR